MKWFALIIGVVEVLAGLGRQGIRQLYQLSQASTAGEPGGQWRMSGSGSQRRSCFRVLTPLNPPFVSIPVASLAPAVPNITSYRI